jgi:hypothetical protein
LLDNDSTYPPLKEFLAACPYRVVYLERNLGHTALWQMNEMRKLIFQNWFVYSDPDVIPVESCPLDAVGEFYRLLCRFPRFVKAGFGLRFDDLPPHYHLRSRVMEWEKNQYKEEIQPNVFEADIDTTFALYRPGTPYCYGPAIRTLGKYQARHLAWYVDSEKPDAEEIFYRSHAVSSVTTWNVSGDVKPLNGVSGRSSVRD